MKNQKCEPENANGNAKVRTLRLYIKVRTVRCFANKKSANLLKVSGLLHKKMRTAFAFRGERGIRTPEPLLTVTRFPGVPLQPLEHLSL